MPGSNDDGTEMIVHIALDAMCAELLLIVAAMLGTDEAAVQLYYDGAELEMGECLAGYGIEGLTLTQTLTTPTLISIGRRCPAHSAVKGPPWAAGGHPTRARYRRGKPL